MQTIRLSKQEVDILNSLKRRTKINHWNVLCRMAFCESCREQSDPQVFGDIKNDSNVELDWATFAGEQTEIYMSLVIRHKELYAPNRLEPEHFRRLLFRGIFLLKEKIGKK